MVRRPISQRNGPKGELASLAFGVMATHWSRDKRQDLFDFISCAVYSQDQESKLWHYTKQMAKTKEKEPFHQLEITIQDGPADWFQNLKLLQIRETLGLDCLLQVQCKVGRLMIGELTAKMDALCSIVGNAKMKRHKLPMLKRKAAVRDFPPKIGNIRIDSLCAQGLQNQRT